VKARELKAMSLSELKALRGRVDKAIEGHEAQKKKAALKELQQQAKALGFSLSDLVAETVAKPKRGPKPAAKAKAKVKAPAAYANPADPSQTWSGRGRRPDWVKAALGEGKDLSALAIGKST
jgi:DNA-binding protein H-NS